MPFYLNKHVMKVFGFISKNTILLNILKKALINKVK